MQDSPAIQADRGVQIVLMVIGAAAAVILLHLSSFASLFSMWTLSTYRYAYLIFPMAGYLLWRQRAELAVQQVGVSWNGYCLLLVLSLLWLGSRAVNLQAGEHLAVILMIPAFVLAVLGREVFFCAAFPLMLLVAAAPVYDPLVPPLMIVTADISEWLLQAVGHPVLRERQYFTLPVGRFQVADVCAGLRYLLAGVVTASVFAHVSFRSWRKQLVFVSIAAVAFIVANGVRSFLVMYIFSLSDGRIFRDSHQGFGMTLFAVVMVGILLVGLRFADRRPAAAAHQPALSGLVLSRASIVTWIAAICILAVVPVAQAFREERAGAGLTWPELPRVPGCQSPVRWSADWGPFMIGSDAERSGTYDCGPVSVDVFIAAYGMQREGKELISSENEMLPDEMSGRSRYSTKYFAGVQGDRIKVTEAEVVGEFPEVVWSWYSVGDVAVLGGFEVKLREAANALRLRADPSALYVVAVRGKPAASLVEAGQSAAQVAQAVWESSAPGRVRHAAP